jgi:glucosylceramidase
MKPSCVILLAVTGCSAFPSGASGDASAPPAGDDAGGPAQEAGGGEAAAPDASPSPPPSPAPPAAYVTTDDLTKALEPTPITFGDGGTADVTITLDPATKYQPIIGFGASITDSSSYVLTQHLSASALHEALVKLFDPAQGVGLSFLRQPMGATDFSSVGNFSYDDVKGDAALVHFAIDQDMKSTIPVLRQVLAIEPGLFILGTPWSPPAWMKLNGSMNGSGGAPGDPGLAADAYEPLAQYFVRFVQAYAQQGIVVAAVTPQNEPLNGSASYPGMGLDAPSELTLIAQHMAPALRAAGLSTQIWAYDHNWDAESYPDQIASDAVAGAAIEGAAFHCYGGDPSAMTTFHDAHPTKSVYMTECSGGDWQDDPFANTIDLAIDSTVNWARGVVLWNLVLDENKGPQNHGCPSCRGVITVNSQSGAVTYNADYYALGHFSKFVRPGAVRIGSSAPGGALRQVAFANADGRLAVVTHNTGGASIRVRVGSGAGALNVGVPAGAAVTVAWTP